MSPAARPIRVLTVDDHPMLREGIAAVIQLQSDIVVVGEAENGADAVERFAQLKPDITLMDLQMPVMNGLDAIKAIRRDHPAARIVVLTTYDGDVQALMALKAGAAGYLLKSTLRKDLLDAIRAVHAGRRHIPAEIAGQIAQHISDELLSEREMDILRLVAAGNPNKRIALTLAISEQTVKAHLKNIFGKLSVADRTQAVTVAVKRGIIAL